MYPKQVLRYIAGNYSTEDKLFVENWLREDPARKEELSELINAWELSGRFNVDVNINQAWKRFSSSLIDNYSKGLMPKKDPSIKRLDIFYKVAASILVLIGTFWMYKVAYTHQEIIQQATVLKYVTVQANSGEQKKFSFSDGSKVVLNASSKIHYREDYGYGSRTVYLEGEAYFEVNHNHALPFIVQTRKSVVEDIGTKFNIKAYREENEEQVVVSEGSVKVSSNNLLDAFTPDESKADKITSVIVDQGHQVTVSDKKNQLIVNRADLSLSLGWLNQHLIFDREPLAQVIKKLERFYDVEVTVNDPKLLTHKITGSFENERLENVLKVISISLEMEFSKNGKEVTFFAKNK